jgi:hypothetical protein
MKKEECAVNKRKELLVKLKAYEQRLLAQVKRPKDATQLGR